MLTSTYTTAAPERPSRIIKKASISRPANVVSDPQKPTAMSGCSQ